jgi:RNA polymerase sigma-70 factor (ECF subfamily)
LVRDSALGFWDRERSVLFFALWTNGWDGTIRGDHWCGGRNNFPDFVIGVCLGLAIWAAEQRGCDIYGILLAFPVLFMDARALAKLSDEELVRRFQTTGRPAFFEELWRRHCRMIHARCYAFVRDPDIADDLTAETFLKVLKSISSYRSERFEGWLIAIARTTCLNHLQRAHVRREKPHHGDERQVMDDSKPSPEDSAWAAQVRDFVGQLPPKQRVAIKLYYIERYTYEEIAVETGQTVKAVKSHLQNGIRRLRILCQRQGAGK